MSILLWAMTAYPKKPVFDHDYDAQREAVEAEYLAGVNDVGVKLGVPADKMVAWAGNEDALEGARAEFWEQEPGFAEAGAAYEKAKEELSGGPGGEELASFADALDLVNGIEDRFTEEAEGMEEGSYEYRLAESLREKSLEDLRLDPELLGAVRLYRDDVLAARIERNGEIDNAEEGERLECSISGRIGRFLEPVFKPLGFDWRVVTAIIGSFAAKEVFVAQMGIVYSVGEADEESDSLREKLRANYSQLQAFCMMLWALLSLPCVVTVAVAKRETGGWKWVIFMMVALTLTAYVTCLVVYQAGSALGVGVS